MEHQNKRLTDYINLHYKQGMDSTSIRQHLVQSGWDEYTVDRALRRTPKLQVDTLEPSSDTKMSAKVKPPVAAQILYALGFVGLICGLFIALMTFIGASASSSSSLGGFFGISSLGIKISAIILAAITIGGFTLINFIRAGKVWALATYSAIALLGFTLTVIEILSRSELEKAIYSSDDTINVLGYILMASLLSMLWTKNRKYFK